MAQKFNFQSHVHSKILKEVPSEHNPFVAQQRLIAGYDNLELSKHLDFLDVLLLMANLELPEPEDKGLLNQLMIGLISPGNRHPAVRATVSAGASKARTEAILPIGLTALSGKSGAGGMEQAMEDVRLAVASDDNVPSASVLFGALYGSPDPYLFALGTQLTKTFPDKPHLAWVVAQAGRLQDSENLGLTDLGLCAAVFCDLGLEPRAAVGMFQMLYAPGLFFQGVEQAHKPVSHLPFLEDEHYAFK